MNVSEFLFGDNGDTHRPMLWFALELTKDRMLPVGEFGSGYGSTSYLKNYCIDAGREFYSYDNDKEWAAKWGSQYITDWLDINLYKESSVVLIDQGPAEDRKLSIERLAHKACVIVAHDAEPENNHAYRYDAIYHLFKYKVFTRGPQVWTMALSNKIDLVQHAGESILNFKIEL